MMAAKPPGINMSMQNADQFKKQAFNMTNSSRNAGRYNALTSSSNTMKMSLSSIPQPP
jgi:hypothetical protein